MPANSTLYQSPLLSSIAVDFKNREYIAPQILTPVVVPRLQGQYLVWDQGVTFKDPKTQMGQDASPNMIDLKATKSAFSLDIHAQAAYVDPLEQSQAPEAQVRAMKIAKLMNIIELRRELDVAAQLTSTSVLTSNTTLSGTGQWSDYTNSDPINAIAVQADALPKRPNTFIAGRDVITKLRMHPKVLSAIQYTQTGGMAPLSALAALFEVDRILVGDAFKDTAADNLTAVKSRIWGKDAILAYIDPSPPSPLMDSPTLGYLPTLGMNAQVYTGRNPERGTGSGSEFLKVETAYGILVSAPSMAYLWKAAVA
jgi:hypothetical protein